MMTKRSLVESVMELHERFSTAVRLANDNALVAQSKSKQWYDKCAKDVAFEFGQQDLLLLPLIDKSLEAKYAWPYVGLERLDPVDYWMAILDRQKRKHVDFVK